MTQMIAGRYYYATPAGYIRCDENGDCRPVYYFTSCCPGDKYFPMTPLGGTANVDGDVRPLYGISPCIDGQLKKGTVVTLVYMGYTATVDGDTRPVYAFVCCPAGSSSSSSSSSSSGGINPPCFVSACGFPPNLPSLLYGDISGTGCILDGTWELTYTDDGYSVSPYLPGAPCWYNVGSSGSCSYVIFLTCEGDEEPIITFGAYIWPPGAPLGTYEYGINQTQSGVTFSCDPFYMYGSITVEDTPNPNWCDCYTDDPDGAGTVTLTITE